MCEKSLTDHYRNFGPQDMTDEYALVSSDTYFNIWNNATFLLKIIVLTGRVLMKANIAETFSTNI